MTSSTLSRETLLLRAARSFPRVGLLPWIVAFSLLIAASARVTIHLPWTPVPITMQPFMVLLCGALLGSRAGAAAVGLYLLEGAIGMPVFKDGTSGPGALLLSHTTGYLLAFPLAAFVTGFWCERGWDKKPVTAMLAMSAGLLVIYAGGWLVLSLYFGARAAFAGGVAPFVGPDVLKIAVAALGLPLGWKLLQRDV